MKTALADLYPRRISRLPRLREQAFFVVVVGFRGRKEGGGGGGVLFYRVILLFSIGVVLKHCAYGKTLVVSRVVEGGKRLAL